MPPNPPIAPGPGDPRHPSAALARLRSRYVEVIADIYRAGSGTGHWRTPISAIAEVFESWIVQFLCVNPRNGVIQWAYEGGSSDPAAGVDFLRKYHRIDPRLKDLVRLPIDGWYSCEDHFDEEAVQRDPYYTEYLIPYGGRYCYAGKIHEDENSIVLIGAITRVGQAPMADEEKAEFTRLAEHFREALKIQRSAAEQAGRISVGVELLEKMRQPMILIDNERRIGYRNSNARALLARADLLHESGGSLVCRDNESDLNLTLALRELQLVPVSTYGAGHVPKDRVSLKLRRRDRQQVTGTLLALRPEGTMGSFGPAPQALVTLFEPAAPIDIDPFVLSTTFDLTPAEARLAVRIVNGRTPEQCAADLQIKISTVRTQLMSIYRKTGVAGQVDLVRLVLSASAV